MSWLPILALTGLVFLAAAVLLRLPRSGYTLLGAALLFGLSGYALQGSPGLPAAPRPERAGALDDGGLLVEARREFFDTARLPSRFVVTADAFTRRGQYADAAGLLRNAVTENPQDAEAWLALGNVLVEHAGGQLTAAALYAYSRAEAADPGNPAPTYFLGIALLRAGRPQETRALWAELLANAPPDASWRAALADRLARLDAMLGRPPAAPPSIDPEMEQ